MIPNRYTKQYKSKCGEFFLAQNFKTGRYHMRCAGDLDDWAELVRDVSDGYGARGSSFKGHDWTPNTTIVLG